MLAEGTREARIGKALGEIVGGLALTIGGLSGKVAGIVMTSTGVGALAGVPAIAVSAVAVVGGGVNVGAGIRGLSEALSTGAGPGPSGNGPRVSGESLRQARAEFSKVKPAFWKREAAVNGSKYSPENVALMKRGKAPIGSDGHPMELHHKNPLAEGGTNDFDNLIPLTRSQHRLGDQYKINHPGLP